MVAQNIQELQANVHVSWQPGRCVAGVLAPLTEQLLAEATPSRASAARRTPVHGEEAAIFNRHGRNARGCEGRCVKPGSAKRNGNQRQAGVLFGHANSNHLQFGGWYGDHKYAGTTLRKQATVMAAPSSSRLLAVIKGVQARYVQCRHFCRCTLRLTVGDCDRKPCLPTESLYFRSAKDRGFNDFGWLQTYHVFSFAPFYKNPAHRGYGVLRVLNDDVVAAGKGFEPHSHSNMDIVSFVVDGALEHRDSLGNGSIIKTGEVQRMSAGKHIEHSEYNPHPAVNSRFLQFWFLPRKLGGQPSYQQVWEAVDLSGCFDCTWFR
jgi:hypothetical protein